MIVWAPVLWQLLVGVKGLHRRLGVPESQREAPLHPSGFLAVRCLSFSKLISHAFHACSLNPFDVFLALNPVHWKALSGMVMFSDWLMNLLINPLVCTLQHCLIDKNAIRMGGGKASCDRMTCCQWGRERFQSQWQFGLKWSPGLILSATYFCEKSSLGIKKNK